MQWSREELLYELLEKDRAARILFVEGADDLRLWRALVPTASRRNAFVYPVSVVQLGQDAGNIKRAALDMAQYFSATPVESQIRFFLDSDNDRLLGRAHTSNVILTDFRDREAYFIEDEPIRALVEAFTLDEERPLHYREAIRQLGRPLGWLRAISERDGLKLPFRKSLTEPRRHRKYFGRDNDIAVIDLTRLVNNLLRHAGRPVSELDEVVGSVEKLSEKRIDLDDRDVVCGKDLIAITAWWFTCSEEEASRLIYMTLCRFIDLVASYPAIMEARTFLAKEAA